MGKYRLSLQAGKQIRDIGRFTLRRFGVYQAEAYHAGLERTFGLLADFPKMGVAADELLVGVRRFRFQSHRPDTPAAGPAASDCCSSVIILQIDAHGLPRRTVGIA